MAGKEKLDNHKEIFLNKLDIYYQKLKSQIVKHQNVVSGLYPDHLASEKGSISSVRESIYCAAVVWALSQAYRRANYDLGRGTELRHVAVKTMRGVLFCWMWQAEQLEKFKEEHTPENALHSSFDLSSGKSLKDSFRMSHHLQIDVVALYLIFLTEMIASGLEIVNTSDEVNFVQNLVFYVERYYRIPDFGMWGRGSKYNNGTPELFASTIGLVKSAIECVSGFNLFGTCGAPWSVIFVDIDAHNRNRTIFESMLPRESNSKPLDAALIPSLRWPAFASHNKCLVDNTLNSIVESLEGSCGFKRFIRDGYGCPLEKDKNAYYNPEDVRLFDGIESEWPIFYAFMVVSSVFNGDTATATRYFELMKPLLIETDNGHELPAYYMVDELDINAELTTPGSTQRIPKKGPVFLWGQAIYLLAEMLMNGVVSVHDLDPVFRHLSVESRPFTNARYSHFQGNDSTMVVQVALIAKSVALQQRLAKFGIEVQTLEQVEPYEIWSPDTLVEAFSYLGANEKLHLSGRPRRPVGGLGTSKVYRFQGRTIVCYPLVMEHTEFYLSQDVSMIIDDVRSEIRFLSQRWRLSGRPILCVLIRNQMVSGPSVEDFLELLMELKRGICSGVHVHLSRLQSILPNSCVEHLDFLSAVPRNELLKLKSFGSTNRRLSVASLSDIPKSSTFKDPDDDRGISLASWRERDIEFLRHTLEGRTEESANVMPSLLAQAQILLLIKEKCGLDAHAFGCDTVRQAVNSIMKIAGARRHWAVVRLVAAIAEKMVDSIAPAVSSLIVRRMFLTVGKYPLTNSTNFKGVPDANRPVEEEINKPLSPSQLSCLLYRLVYPLDPVLSVIQQEVIRILGMSCSSSYELFNGIMKLRIGWIVHALSVFSKSMERDYKKDTPEWKDGVDMDDLYRKSPSQIKFLLLRILHISKISGYNSRFSKSIVFEDRPDYDSSSMTDALESGPPVSWSLWRMMAGALGRVPSTFYEEMWFILERSSGGVIIGGFKLSQYPTIADMSPNEMTFSLLIEQMMSYVIEPQKRQLISEVCMVIAEILRRNPEVSFTDPIDVEQIADGAIQLYTSMCIASGSDSSVDLFVTEFYDLAPHSSGGTVSFIARVVVNSLLGGSLVMTGNEHCSIL